MEPNSRNLDEEKILEDIINDAPDFERAESPSSYLNPSGDGMEVERHEDEVDGEGDNSDDGEGDSSADGDAGGELTKSGEVYIYICSAITCNYVKNIGDRCILYTIDNVSPLRPPHRAKRQNEARPENWIHERITH